MWVTVVFCRNLLLNGKKGTKIYSLLSLFVVCLSSETTKDWVQLLDSGRVRGCL